MYVGSPGSTARLLVQLVLARAHDSAWLATGDLTYMTPHIQKCDKYT